MYPKFEWDPKIEVCWNAPHPLWKIKVYVSCNPTISTKSPDIPYGHFVCWESIQRFDKKLLDLDGFYMLLYNEKPTNFHGNLQRFPLARKRATSSSSAFSEVVRQWMLNSKRGVLPESGEADATMGAMDIFKGRKNMGTYLDGNQKSGVHSPVEGTEIYHYLQGFIHPRISQAGKKDMVTWDPETNSNFAPENEWFLIGISSSRGPPFSGANC